MTLDGLLENVERACSTDVVSLTLIRKYARTSWRWMEAYRRQITEDWSPELTAFAAKSYHGHRGVPPSMDRIIEELTSHRRMKAAEKGKFLMDRDRDRVSGREGQDPVPVPNLSLIDPVKLIGLTVRKDFDGFGSCKGVVRSTGVELVSNRVIFNVEYSDGEFENIYLDGIVQYVRSDEVLLHVK